MLVNSDQPGPTEASCWISRCRKPRKRARGQLLHCWPPNWKANSRGPRHCCRCERRSSRTARWGLTGTLACRLVSLVRCWSASVPHGLAGPLRGHLVSMARCGLAGPFWSRWRVRVSMARSWRVAKSWRDCRHGRDGAALRAWLRLTLPRVTCSAGRAVSP
jgi:hypothetical protein